LNIGPLKWCGAVVRAEVEVFGSVGWVNAIGSVFAGSLNVGQSALICASLLVRRTYLIAGRLWAIVTFIIVSVDDGMCHVNMSITHGHIVPAE
jgi:hypothetical protein